MTMYVCRVCGKFFNSDTLSECPFCHTPVKPKYAGHVWQSDKTVMPLDSVAFLCPNCGCYIISDTSKGENPQAVGSWIRYPRAETVQFRLGGSGDFHVEKLGYYTKLPSEWKERFWIILPERTANLLKQCLARDPLKVESWM